MTYLVFGAANCSLVREWVSKLDDTLVYAEDNALFSTYTNSWQTSVIASGSGETLLLLKFGNILV